MAGSATAVGGTAAVCRYYGRPEAGLDTHFHSASSDECAAVGRNGPGRWMLESSNVFRVYMPDTTTGRCPAGTLPVDRPWNRRADVDHRFTMDPDVQAAMMARGHAAEGYGNPPVAMCSPQ